MKNYTNEIEKRLVLLKDEILVKIVTEEFEDYEPETLETVKRILTDRGIDYNRVNDEFENETYEDREHKELSIPIYYELSQSSGGYESIYRYKEEVIEKRKHKNLTVRPWVRYWARAIDLMIWGLLTRETIKFFSLSTYNFLTSIAYGYIFSIIVFITWVIGEGYVLSRFGYTFGKWLLNVHIRNSDGKKLDFGLSIKRVIYVWFLGEGLSIPYLAIVTNLISYLGLKSNGITKWDSKLNVEVRHSKIGWVRSILAIIILLVPSIPTLIKYINK